MTHFRNASMAIELGQLEISNFFALNLFNSLKLEILRGGRSLNHFWALSCNILHIIASLVSVCMRIDAIECLNKRTRVIGSLVPQYDVHHSLTNFWGYSCFNFVTKRRGDKLVTHFFNIVLCFSCLMFLSSYSTYFIWAFHFGVILAGSLSN